jgi:hypothetical protein
VGVLFNDETKIIFNPFFDKMHYFNGLDMLMYSHDEFSTKSLNSFSTDLRKKVKILSYLKKMLKTSEAKVSLTNQKETQVSCESVVYLKNL